jgi:transposase
MAVERVREGEVASAVITSYGFNRTTIYKWLTAAAKPGVGLRAVARQSGWEDSDNQDEKPSVAAHA